MNSPMYSPSYTTSPGKRSRDSPMDEQVEYQDQSRRPSGSSRNESSVHDEFDPDEIGSGTALQGTNATRYRSNHDTKAPASATDLQGSLTRKQKRLLRQWYEDFREPDVVPSLPEEYIKALALVIRAQPHLVAEYFEYGQGRLDHNMGHIQDIADADRAPSGFSGDTYKDEEPYSLTSANNHLPSATLALVEKYVSACRRRRSRTDGRRSVNMGPFKCTFGCGYRTKRAFDWRRHEETHEPQELWLCTICTQRDTSNPFLVNRKDKFLKHASDKHAEYSAERVLEESKVAFVPRSDWSCVYCGTENGSWDDRCRHVLGHFEDEVERSMKRPRIVHEGREDDEPFHRDSASVRTVESDGHDNDGSGQL